MTSKQSGSDLKRLPDCDGLRKLSSSGGVGSNSDDINEAQQFAYDAWDEPDRTRRNLLARKALARSPLCADAWLQLSELRNLSDSQRREYLLRAVCAGELAIGERRFAEAKGDFWLILDTRPYMRARFALAQDLWYSCDRNERIAAIAHLREMLDLNPNDNQGLRYVLLVWLIRTDAYQAAEDMLDKHRDEISAFMEFTRVLLAYRTLGDCEKTHEMAAKAYLANRHIPHYLAHSELWHEGSGTYSPGRESEAAWYAQELGIDWFSTHGAIEWLAHCTDREPVRNRDGETLH
jgi:tetratricopeptide (TPR) repeat protein